ncbi:hypothetical protein RRG08_028349 [Elysia crispata]|uniref:Uncharacterized protein n=1 Tax=Elysia crispata TaxID=231223 RepID=A0AAE1E6B3_9GAST|nr:hypothetical protein RRG08_028349 [Elysia crispata]
MYTDLEPNDGCYTVDRSFFAITWLTQTRMIVIFMLEDSVNASNATAGVYQVTRHPVIHLKILSMRAMPRQEDTKSQGTP